MTKPKAKRGSCSRCHKEPRWYNDLCVTCTGIANGTVCASEACQHHQSRHPILGVCNVHGCGCQQFVREEAA